MGYYIGGLEFEKKKIFLWCVEEILNNPVQQYKYFHICIKSINMYVTVRTGGSMSEISICTQSTFGYVTINTRSNSVVVCLIQ